MDEYSPSNQDGRDALTRETRLSACAGARNGRPLAWVAGSSAKTRTVEESAATPKAFQEPQVHSRVSQSRHEGRESAFGRRRRSEEGGGGRRGGRDGKEPGPPIVTRRRPGLSAIRRDRHKPSAKTLGRSLRPRQALCGMWKAFVAPRRPRPATSETRAPNAWVCPVALGPGKLRWDKPQARARHAA